MNKCSGCGALTDLPLCERCFRIRHYNEYKQVVKSNQDFLPILEQINKTNDLVVLVVDLFNIPDLTLISKSLTNDILLVLTKRDLLPQGVYDEKLLSYPYGVTCVDKIIISSVKNTHLDELFDKINQFKKSEHIYIVGYTNAGKSTLINHLLYHYSDNDTVITTSPLPSTTLDMIEVKLNDLILYDTPGFIMEGDMLNYIDGSALKKVVPKKVIKPITYQVKKKQTIVIDSFLQIEVEKMDITLFISNNLAIKRFYKEIPTSLVRHEVMVNHNDIVIRGFGFIKTNKKGKVIIYTLPHVDVFTRSSLI